MAGLGTGYHFCTSDHLFHHGIYDGIVQGK
jgi:hypothetical protein